MPPATSSSGRRVEADLAREVNRAVGGDRLRVGADRLRRLRRVDRLGVCQTGDPQPARLAHPRACLHGAALFARCVRYLTERAGVPAHDHSRIGNNHPRRDRHERPTSTAVTRSPPPSQPRSSPPSACPRPWSRLRAGAAAPDRRRGCLRDRHRPGSPPDDGPGRLELTRAHSRCPAADGRAPFFRESPMTRTSPTRLERCLAWLAPVHPGGEGRGHPVPAGARADGRLLPGSARARSADPDRRRRRASELRGRGAGGPAHADHSRLRRLVRRIEARRIYRSSTPSSSATCCSSAWPARGWRIGFASSFGGASSASWP